MARYRIGVDIGGTFTDFVMVDRETGRLFNEKVLTTPHDPSRAVIDGVGRLLRDHRIDPGDVAHRDPRHDAGGQCADRAQAVAPALGMHHAGFRDILEMGTEQRYDIYDLFLKFPEPLVPRDRRWRSPSAWTRRAAWCSALDADSAAEVRARWRNWWRQACRRSRCAFLHSYRNPPTSGRGATCCARGLSRLAVSLSSDVVPEIGEYQRGVTTAGQRLCAAADERYLEAAARTAARGFRATCA
jgi:5-oxoprolinase (ATP-hydrolysing)